MDSLTFVSQVVASLAWPAGLVLIAFAFRRPLLTLLGRMYEVKYGEFTATFQREAILASDDASRALPKNGQLPPAPSDELMDLAQVSPVAAIHEAWNRVDLRIRGLAARSLSDADSLNAGAAVRRLEEEGAINDMTARSVIGLLNLRNLAVHGPIKEVDPAKATEFVILASAALFNLQAPWIRVAA